MAGSVSRGKKAGTGKTPKKKSSNKAGLRSFDKALKAYYAARSKYGDRARQTLAASRRVDKERQRALAAREKKAAQRKAARKKAAKKKA